MASFIKTEGKFRVSFLLFESRAQWKIVNAGTEREKKRIEAR